LGGELLTWDDDRFIESNEMIRSPSLENVELIFGQPHFEAYHPLHLLSYMIDYQLFGLWAPGYKLHNLVLYLACLVLLWLLLRRLGLDALSAWVGTLIFAVHPLHVETVVWATSRKEPLSLALMLAALLTYLGRGESKRFAWATMGLFVLALLTKTSTIVLPALLLFIDLLVLNRGWKKSLLRVAPLFVVGLAVGFYVIILWQANEMVRPPPENGQWGMVAIVGKTLWHHLSMVFWPTGLSPLYELDRVGAWDARAIAGYGSWTVLAAIALRWGRPLYALAVLWALAALGPVSNVVPVNWQVQDRYALIATVGLAIAAGATSQLFLSRSPRLPWVAALVAVATALPLGLTSAAYAAHWPESVPLWQRATAVEPGAYYAHLGLGHAHRRRGELDDAARAYERAIAVEPDFAVARISLCMIRGQQVSQSRDGSANEAQRLAVNLYDAWHNPNALEEMTVDFLTRGSLVCAALAEDREFAIRPAAPSRLIRAASRWTGLGQGARALRLLERLSPTDLDREASGLEVQAQALALEGENERAHEALARSLRVLPRPPERLLHAAQEFQRRGLVQVALMYASVVDPTGEDPRWQELRQSSRRPSQESEEIPSDTRREDHDQ
jgi:tetratricopeptide (TPR) repeat protein